MLAHRRATRTEPFGEIARVPRLLAQEIDHAAPCAIRKRAKRRVELIHDLSRIRCMKYQW